MAESDDIRALENISTEVDNSQMRILISSHCMKAQTFLLDKLRKQTERQKEICKFIGSSNLKLETEIKIAESEITSLKIATDTIKLGNIELNKEYLLSKERKAEILERIKIGTKKYNNLWSISKKRYESIPIIQKCIEIKNKNQTVQANIHALINESQHLVNDIQVKKNNIEAINRARVIELADFIARERANMFIKINENDVKIREVLNEIELLEREKSEFNCNVPFDQALVTDCKQEAGVINESDTLHDNWSNLNTNTEKDTLMMPKLHLQNSDLNILNIKFDQINKVDLQHTTAMKRASSSILSDLEENPHKTHKTGGISENYISSYFDISLNSNDKKICNSNYSEKKLIHILEDIKMNKNDTFNIIKKLEPTQFHATEYITSSKNMNYSEKFSNAEDEVNKKEPVEKIKSTEPEETVATSLQKTPEEIDPSSQFLDVSQSSQEKKTVSFNIANEAEMKMLPEKDNSNYNVVDFTETQEKILNNSTTSDESYTTIKVNTLKKRNLELSPQFVYSKSNLTKYKNQEDKVTSKFFESESQASPANEYNTSVNQNQILISNESKSNVYENEISSVDVNNVVISSPKEDNKNLEVPVAGFLFNHGLQGIQESLNLSMSTTGFEDGEDYPLCIDSSVLLSPKADLAPISSSHNNEVLSQEAPNFLAGFRKTSLSFFGNTTAGNKTDSSAQSQNGAFNFAFGNEEKKARCGFFSMFH